MAEPPEIVKQQFDTACRIKKYTAINLIDWHDVTNVDLILIWKLNTYNYAHYAASPHSCNTLA